MLGLRPWLRPPGSLLLLFVVVTLLPAVTLVFLGVRLLQQDRALAEQRRFEILDHAPVLTRELELASDRLCDSRKIRPVENWKSVEYARA